MTPFMRQLVTDLKMEVSGSLGLSLMKTDLSYVIIIIIIIINIVIITLQIFTYIVIFEKILQIFNKHFSVDYPEFGAHSNWRLTPT